MSQLRIQHRTQYSYSGPVEFGRHRLVLRPREGHDLRVLSMIVRIAPAHHLTWTRDVYGNSVAVVDFEEQAAELEIATDVVVERWPSVAQLRDSTPWAVPYPVQYDVMEAQLTAAYQAFTFPQDIHDLNDWLKSAVPEDSRHDAEAMMLHLCRRIDTDIQYLRRSEKGVQSPAFTLQEGRGSCRDTATLMLEAGRSLGIACRFVSGYLHCAASQVGRASTHAWMEAYLPALGWRGFDPSIGEPVSAKHIPIGVSQHPRGVMPVSGLWSGHGERFVAMTVQVSIVDSTPVQ
jgi:transglutaminase-like putative cysteine protease